MMLMSLSCMELQLDQWLLTKGRSSAGRWLCVLWWSNVVTLSGWRKLNQKHWDMYFGLNVCSSYISQVGLLESQASSKILEKFLGYSLKWLIVADSPEGATWLPLLLLRIKGIWISVLGWLLSAFCLLSNFSDDLDHSDFSATSWQNAHVLKVQSVKFPPLPRFSASLPDSSDLSCLLFKGL